MEGTSLALTPWMKRIAFDLGRSSVIDLDHEALCGTANRHRRVVEVRTTGNIVFNAACHRHDVRHGTATGRQSSEAERGRHQLHYFAARGLVQHLRGSRRKLVFHPRLE